MKTPKKYEMMCTERAIPSVKNFKRIIKRNKLTAAGGEGNGGKRLQ